jgi:hypothetical protein
MMRMPWFLYRHYHSMGHAIPVHLIVIRLGVKTRPILEPRVGAKAKSGAHGRRKRSRTSWAVAIVGVLRNAMTKRFDLR